MPGFVKKVVRTEYVPVELGKGMTFGQLLDEQIDRALEDSRDGSGTFVQEFSLHFEESEWQNLVHRRK